MTPEAAQRETTPGADQEAGRAFAHDAELLDYQVLGARRDDLVEEAFQRGGDELGAGLDQDGGGAGQHGKKAEQGRVGGGLGIAESSRHRGWK